MIDKIIRKILGQKQAHKQKFNPYTWHNTQRVPSYVIKHAGNGKNIYYKDYQYRGKMYAYRCEQGCTEMSYQKRKFKGDLK